MLTISDNAKEKLDEIVMRSSEETKKTIRVIVSDAKDSDLEFIWDNEKEDDVSVKSENGRTVLVVQPELAKALDGMELDYEKTPEKAGFTVNRKRKIS